MSPQGVTVLPHLISTIYFSFFEATLSLPPASVPSRSHLDPVRIECRELDTAVCTLVFCLILDRARSVRNSVLLGSNVPLIAATKEKYMDPYSQVSHTAGSMTATCFSL
ncbi:hypothetical protein SCLCIDRAFT_1217126 [Scleroderma citrinum Foug A]|uniref:Uncharacterized protein n=1 Tax=Scleroderma citrinum Foug A TaxID=1036808 RepID=A0A0C3A5X2_9AGAM|nr:hypothetical protein SCLCIDRAFT_1217126 [Scleroderma citrinum Foug A]